MTEVYGPEEQVLILSEQLYNLRQSPFNCSESQGKTSEQAPDSPSTSERV